MGFFDFVKDAGSSIFGGDADEKDIVKPLGQHLREHGVDTSNLQIKYGMSDGEQSVTISGEVDDQDTKEKIVLICGNVKGIGKVEDCVTVRQAGNVNADNAQHGTGAAVETPDDWGSKTYTVQPGDTLGKIAKEVYGSAGKYPVIFEANTPMLKDPNKIYPGQVLRIPALND